MVKDKIGVGIITYNSESYFKTLFESLPLDRIDCLVVANGGDDYKDKYDADWIQHNTNYYPAVCRNDCINFLLNRGCEHIFLIEDDMIITNPEIFDKYINTSKQSGLNYLCFVSTSDFAGEPFNRTPELVVEYKDDTSVSFYRNMCNEFTYHHKTCFDKVGLYDTSFRDPFDVDMAYRESQQDYAAPFWWFADVTGSDDYIKNNPDAVSRLQAQGRPDGSREQRIREQWDIFIKKHGLFVSEIPRATKQQVISKLKKIKPNYED